MVLATIIMTNLETMKMKKAFQTKTNYNNSIAKMPMSYKSNKIIKDHTLNLRYLQIG